MEEENHSSKAFLEAAERTMDTGYQSHFVLPGGDVTTEVCKFERWNPKLGGGLRQRESRLTVTRVGSLRYRPPKTYWVESNGRRYIPKQEDQVVVLLQLVKMLFFIFIHGDLLPVSQGIGDSGRSGGGIFQVNIFGASSALLPLLAFDGASKHDKPNLRTGALVFCRMSLTDRVLSFSLSPSIYPTMNRMPSCSHLSHQILVDKYYQWNIQGENVMLLKGGRLGLIGIHCANLGLICIPYVNLICALLQIWDRLGPFLKMRQKTGAACIC